MDELLSTVKSMISAQFFDGVGLLFAFFVVGLLKTALDRLNEAVSERVKEWLKISHNLLVVLIFVAVALFLFDKYRLWALGVVAAAVIGYFAVGRWYPALLSSKLRVAGMVLACASAFAIAYSLDVYLEERRVEQFDIAFLLPPDGVSTEPEQLFAGLRRTLNVTFNGVDRIRIVPEQLKAEDMPKYSYDDPQHLLEYRTRDGSPKVFIRNSSTQQENRMRMVIIPYQRRPGGNGIERVKGWNLNPLVGAQEKIQGLGLRSTFDLVSFLATKGLINLSPDAEQLAWRNILDEYELFLALNAPACPAREQLSKLSASKAPLKESQVKQILNAGCAELRENEQASTKISDRTYDTLKARYVPN